MKLAVPYMGQLQGLDARMVRLAEFLGIACETIALAGASEPGEFLETRVPESCTCFIVNPRTVKEWLGSGQLPATLVTFLLRRFKHIVVHGLRVDAFDNEVIAALSQGRLKSVETLNHDNSTYAIAGDAKDICEAFAGVSFGPANPQNDHVLSDHGSGPALRQLISMNGRTFMASVKTDGAEVLFVGSEDLAELNTDVGKSQVAEHFSRLVPQVMALRHVAGDACWRPANVPHATLIIDDPPLWRRYGFMNYERLLALMEEYHFHTNIAFIPYYWKTSAPSTVRLFHQRHDRFSICYHGNDHTGGELAAQDSRILNHLLETARTRMRSFSRLTGLTCDNVMVFPQGHFSRNAMQALKEHGFVAAVNSSHSLHEEQTPLTIADKMQPSILSNYGFPLFLRKYVKHIGPEDVAWNAFFGRPLLVVEHHAIFRDPSPLLDVVALINKTIPQVKWCNLQTSLESACMIRQKEDGAYLVRPYAMVGKIGNSGCAPIRCVAEWPGRTPHAASEMPAPSDESTSAHVDSKNVSGGEGFEIAPGEARTMALKYEPVHRTLSITKPSLRRRIKVFVRRRLSELRDNYLSKSPATMIFVNSVRHVLSR